MTSYSAKRNEEDILKQQKIHQKSSFEWLSKALTIDERGKLSVKEKQDAMAYYKKGIEELKRGIAVVVLGEGNEFERARGLKEKMIKNLSNAQHRFSELSKELCNGNHTPRVVPKSLSPPPRPSPSSSSSPSSRPLYSANRRTGSPQVTKRTTTPQDNKKKASSLLSSLKNVDKKLLEHILDEVIVHDSSVTMSDIAGQEVAKQALREIIILPSLKPEWFTGLRTPPRGLLLFGPPGNGKTMLAQAVATESQWNFFNISAATLTSKWVGEGEKLVRAMFAAAKLLSPSIVFIDELDSLLSERREGEAESSRRIKTQFMVEFQSNESAERILVIGATNRPQELDQAVLRRFPKRIYLPLPDKQTRAQLLSRLFATQNNNLNNNDIIQVARITQGYSASDLSNLARDAAMAPIREVNVNDLKRMPDQRIRNIEVTDLLESLKRIRPSVTTETLQQLQEWNNLYGDVTVT